jgi:uncharacterized protein YjcR
MDKKQKEALVLSMLEKGESYRDIAQKAKVSPNTIKAISNRAGLDETTSITSRVFELYSQDKTPLEVAIALGLKADDAINLHREYFRLLNCTEFTKVYLQIKDNPWAYVNLVKLALDSGMSDDDVLELLNIAKGHLPRVRLEYDRLNAELNSWKTKISNSVRTYQQFCDRNVALKNREDELLKTINKLEAKKTELQKSLSQSKFQESNTMSTNLNLKAKFEEIISASNETIQQPTNNHHQNENNEMLHSPPLVEPSSRKLIFDTKDFFQ